MNINKIRYLLEGKNHESIEEFDNRMKFKKILKSGNIVEIKHFHPTGGKEVPNGSHYQKGGWFSECRINNNSFDTNVPKQTFHINEGGEYIIKEDVHHTQYGLSDYRGGIVVFATTVNAVKLSDNSFVNKIKQIIKSLQYRFGKDKKIDKTVSGFNKENKHDDFIGAFSVGNFFKGKYVGDNERVYNDRSLAIEINGISSEGLKEFAENIANEFMQETVLVKDLNLNKIYLVNGNKTDTELGISNLNKKC